MSEIGIEIHVSGVLGDFVFEEDDAIRDDLLGDPLGVKHELHVVCGEALAMLLFHAIIDGIKEGQRLWQIGRTEQFEPLIDVSWAPDARLAVWDGNASAVSGEHASLALLSLPASPSRRRKWTSLILALVIIGLGIMLWLLPSSDPEAPQAIVVEESPEPSVEPDHGVKRAQPSVEAPRANDVQNAAPSVPGVSPAIDNAKDERAESPRQGAARRKTPQPSRATSEPRSQRAAQPKQPTQDRPQLRNSKYDPEGI